MRRVAATVTTAADGTAAVDTAVINGVIESIVIDSGDLTAGAVDFTITDKDTGLTLLTITDKAAGVAAYPLRDNICGQTGADIAAAATSTNVWSRMPIAGKAHIVVAGGGNVKTGKVYFFVEDNSVYVR